MAGRQPQLTTREASRNLDRTRANILEVATDHFARNGFHGARVDEIADETVTTKRMVHYCFGSKAGLFSACLRAEHARIRAYERDLNLGVWTRWRRWAPMSVPPSGITRCTRSSPVWYAPRTCSTRSAWAGVSIRSPGRSSARSTPSSPAGERRARFREGISGVELHIAVTALGNYRITNQKTVRTLFDFDMRAPERLEHDLDHYCSMILNWLRA